MIFLCEKYLKVKRGTISILPFIPYSLKLGEDFVIELKENHFSSFRWHLSNYDRDLTDLITKKTFDLAPTHIFGRKRIVLWKFRTFYYGKITLHFNLYRSWEGVNSSVEKLIYYITII
ncbi:protease inhibitor I42 family protein [Oceanirhabdus sp. W0125-5]|uniref:protease inhibitor I42 family protein n=1 Tax=Oceanirhabdus sp. W0125-5 TaxID=2999116 RepID=UPI003FA5EC46